MSTLPRRPSLVKHVRGKVRKILGDGRGEVASTPWWADSLSFEIAGRRVRLFVAGHNCGWPPWRMTERSVEVALADLWLGTVDTDRVIEVGAVTPYYWPGRVRNIVDPADPHPAVNLKRSVFDVDLSSAPVLSLSTFEHIGTSDYNLPGERLGVESAFRKVFHESPSFLITVPTGYNEHLDRLIFETDLLDGDVEAHYLFRSPTGNDWREAAIPSEARQPYPKHDQHSPDSKSQSWANGLVVISRGPFL